MKMRRTLSRLITFGILLAGCATTADDAPALVTPDRSLASVLYETRADFEASRARGDSLGMAYAAKDRRKLTQELVEVRTDMSRPMRAIAASTRQMFMESKDMAAGDFDMLAEIDQLSQGEITVGGTLRGVIGLPRQIVTTIGLEMEATLEPFAPEQTQVPVNASKAITIFVQPMEHDVGQPLNVALTVERMGHGADSDAPACKIAGERTELACLVQPGDFTHLALTFENRSEASVSVIIFVSGNQASVSAAAHAFEE